MVLWDVWNTPSLPLLPSPLCPGVVVLDKFPCMGQMDLSKNYSYLIGLLKKTFLGNYKRNVNMNLP